MARKDKDGGGGGKPREIELKFDVNPDDLARLRVTPWLKGLQSGRAVTRELDATYYDTPGLKLRRNGLSFRVRKEGRKFVQCVKARDHAAGAFARFEWEVAVKSPEPDVDRIRANPVLGELMGGDDPARLEPLFRSRIRRTSLRLVSESGDELSCDMDQGEIAAKGDTVPVCELELELVSGDPAHLFDVARRVVATVPARLVNRSKGDRGYALASADTATWWRARPLRHDESATAERVLEATVANCIDQLLANEACVLARAHPEGVHQMRVAARRLRSAFTLFRRILPPGRHAVLDERVRDVVSALGPARDLDVFIGEILTPVIQTLPDNGDLVTLREEATRLRDQGYEQAHGMLTSPAYTGTLLELGAWLHGREWRREASGSGGRSGGALYQSAVDLSRAILEHRHRKLVKAGRRIRHMTASERHALRIAIKKQRYAAEFFGSLYPTRRSRKYVERLAGLQDTLGRMNDVTVARTLLDRVTSRVEGDRQCQVHRAAGLVLGWHARGAGDHERTLIKIWKRFLRARPYWHKN